MEFSWLSFLFGVIATLVVVSLVLPDKWATWLGTRRNLPIVLLPLGIIALILAAGNLIFAFAWAVLQALGATSVEPWVWWTLLAGAFIIILFFITRCRHGFSLRSRRKTSKSKRSTKKEVDSEKVNAFLNRTG